MMMNYKEKYELWFNMVENDELKKQLIDIKNDENEIHDCFYKNLDFGTAGIRGLIGVGSNRLNIYTIMLITECICKYYKNLKKIVICFDNRKNSKLFANTAAMIFAKHNIKVYLVDEIMPSPYLSFCVRDLKCDLGIMITASHNTSVYNGYKVYDSNGCQLRDKDTVEIKKIIEKTNITSIKYESLENYKSNVFSIPNEVLDRYIDSIIKQNFIDSFDDNIKIAYTALNGTGIKVFPKLMEKLSFKNIFYQKEQCESDENFTTCKYPNPEKKAAFEKVLELAKTRNADIVFATDPDADRIGVAILHNSQYILPSGNEIGILLSYFILNELNKKSLLKSNSYIVKSLVSSKLIDIICKNFNIKCKEVPTGFKYIGEYIDYLQKNDEIFLFGMEESYGYLIGDYIRDKDSMSPIMMLSIMCSKAKENNQTLIDILNNIYEKFGNYSNKTVGYKLEGEEGEKKIQYIMNKLRNNIFKEIAGYKVIEKKDYLKDMLQINVISFSLKNEINIIIRPSGTEPLIKVYYSVRDFDSNLFDNLEKNIKKILEIK